MKANKEPHISSTGGRKNLVLAVLAIVCLAGAGLMVYRTVTKKDRELTARRAAIEAREVQDTPEAKEQPTADRGERRSRPGQARKQQQKVALLPPPELDSQQLEQIHQEFWEHYDRAVKSFDAQDWYQLGQWAKGSGLFVEAYHAYHFARLADPRFQPAVEALSQPIEDFGGRVLVQDREEPGKWLWLNRAEFRDKFAIQPEAQWNLSIEQIRSHIKQLVGSDSITNWAELAEIMVRVDLPELREIYARLISKPGFYRLLMRSLDLHASYGLSESQVWLARWDSTGPMNIWLVRQLIGHQLGSKKQEGKESTARGRGTGRMPGPPSGPGRGRRIDIDMGPEGPYGLGAMDMFQRVDRSDPQIKHALALVNALAGRGGRISAVLMGELLAKDKDNGNVLRNLIFQGNSQALPITRFTGPLALQMVQPLGEFLDVKPISQQQWFQAAKLLSRRFTDQGTFKILNSAGQNGFRIPSAVAFDIAVTSDQYSLYGLSTFIENDQIEVFDLRSVFACWTLEQQRSSRGLWRLLSKVVPLGRLDSAGSEVYPRDRMSGVGPDMMIDSPFDGSAMPPDVNVDPETWRMMQERGDPMARPQRMLRSGRPMRGVRAGAAEQQAESVVPVRRTYRPGVNGAIGTNFLKHLCTLEVAKSTEEKKPAQAGRRSGRGRGKTGKQTSVSGLRAARRDAAACLISLYQKQMTGFFQQLLDDPDMGGWGVLGLCLLNDKTSQQALAKRFESQSFEWIRPPSDKKKDQLYPIPPIGPGRISVPLDGFGLPLCGLSAREGLIILDATDSGPLFLKALDQLFAAKLSTQDPQGATAAADQVIETLGRWQPPGTAQMLTDLVESAGDLGLRGQVRAARDPDKASYAASSPFATRLRTKTLQVLGQLGQAQALRVMYRLASFGEANSELGLAARVALAKAGRAEAVDVQLDAIDPDKQDKPAYAKRNTGQVQKILQGIDPSLSSIEDVALLAVRNCPLTESQVARALQILKSLGQPPSSGAGRSRHIVDTAKLQQRLTLALLGNGQAGILRRMARLIEVEESDQAFSARKSKGMDKPKFYWNASGIEKTDQAFLEMVQVLATAKLEDQDAAVEFLEAVLNREARWIEPVAKMLSSWQSDRYLIKLGGFVGSRRDGAGYDSAGYMDANIDGPMSLVDMSARMPGRRSNLINFARANYPKQVQIQAGLAALDLIARFADGRQFLEALTRHNIWKYLAWLRLSDFDSKMAGDGLADVLLAEQGLSAEQYLAFWAMRQIEDQGELAVLPALAKVAQKASASDLQERACDAALVLLKERSEDQVGSLASILADESLSGKYFQPWMSLGSSATQLPAAAADKTFVMLAFGSVRSDCLQSMTGMLKAVLNKRPLGVNAVSLAVDVISKVGPASSSSLLDLYRTIINAKTTVVQEQMQGLRGFDSIDQPMRGQSGRSRAGRVGRVGRAGRAGRRQTGRDYGRGGAGRGGRFTGRAGAGQGRGKTIVYPYAQIAPKIISAIAAMPGNASIKLLQQLVTKRADLVGYLTIAIVARDQKLGNSLLMQHLTNQKQIRDYPGQFALSVDYLAGKPSRQSLKLLGTVLSKSRQSNNRTKAVEAIKKLLDNAEQQELQIDASDPLLASLKSCLGRGPRYDASLATRLIKMLKQWRYKPRVTAELRRLSRSRDQKISQVALEALE